LDYCVLFFYLIFFLLLTKLTLLIYGQTCIKRSHLALLDRWPLKGGSIHMKLSERTRKKWHFNTCDCLIKVITWAGWTVLYIYLWWWSVTWTALKAMIVLVCKFRCHLYLVYSCRISFQACLWFFFLLLLHLTVIWKTIELQQSYQNHSKTYQTLLPCK
jgi:hypothetical protein